MCAGPVGWHSVNADFWADRHGPPLNLHCESQLLFALEMVEKGARLARREKVRHCEVGDDRQMEHKRRGAVKWWAVRAGGFLRQ